MTPFDPLKRYRHRRSIRLKGYDYTRAGAYFVTFVAQHRECLFGKIVDGEIHLNEAGEMLEYWWDELPHKFPSVETDEFVVMPNHFHGIILIVDPDPVGADLRVCPPPGSDADVIQGERVGADLCVCPPSDQGERVGADLRVCPPSDQGAHAGAPQPAIALPDIIQWFKTMTTNAYIRGVKQLGWAQFPGKLWQRDYYEHIVRNDAELNQTRNYILQNPYAWQTDDENPSMEKKPHDR